MTYLTETEFLKLGFEAVEDFEKLETRAAMAVYQEFLRLHRF